MRLNEFTFIPFEVRDKALQYLANLTGDPGADLEALATRIDDALQAAEAAGELSYSYPPGGGPGAEPEAVLFRTGLATPSGEEVLAKCQANRKPGARQRWFGLFFETVRPEGFFVGDMYFRYFSDGTRFLEDVASLAIPERWTYMQYQSKVPYPILRSYLEHTLDRLKQQDRVVWAGSRALFNTGLINKFFKEIYVICDVDPEYPERLLNARPVLENDRVILETFQNRKPPMASFFERITDVVFDPELPINTDDTHIIDDNFARIPAEYQQMRKSQVFALFQSAIEFARIMAARNYKMIVPHVYNGQIQFLMPIYLSGEFAGPPDFVLVLEKIGQAYRGNTILTLDMAYQNARLIAKPEVTWLTVEADLVARQ